MASSHERKQMPETGQSMQSGNRIDANIRALVRFTFFACFCRKKTTLVDVRNPAKP